MIGLLCEELINKVKDRRGRIKNIKHSMKPIDQSILHIEIHLDLLIMKEKNLMQHH